jgi:multiple sugar transport system substrate-binding protein
MSLMTGGAVMAACAPQGTPATEVPAAEQPAAEQPATEQSVAEQPAAETSGEPTNVTFMSWGGNERFQKYEDAWKEGWPEEAKSVVIEALSGGESMETLLRTNMAAGGKDMPDVYESHCVGIPEFAERGITLDIDNFLAPVLSDISDAAKKVITYKDKMYGVPMQIKSKVWWYRKDMFEKAGINPAEVKSVDDLLAAAEALHGTYPDSYLFNMGPKKSDAWIRIMMTMYDDLKFAEEGGDWNVTKDERFAQLFEITKKLYNSNLYANIDDWSTDWGPALTDNKIASIIGPSGANWMAEFLPTLDTVHGDGLWAATLWPEFSRYGSENGGGFWAITKASQHPEAAYTWLSNFYLTQKGSILIYKMLGFLPLINSAKQLVKDEAAKKEKPAGISDDEWKLFPVNYFGMDLFDAIFETQEYHKVFAYDLSFETEISLLGKYCNDFVAGTTSLADALKSAEDEMRNQIFDPYQLS